MPVLALQPGGVQNAYVGYVNYDLTALGGDLLLVWPTSYQDSPNTVAAYMDISNTDGGLQTITLPDATQVSVGQNFIISNIGLVAFSLYDNAGDLLQSIASETAWYYILTDNSSAAGVWHTVQFGAGISQATAGMLAGYGLNADLLPPTDLSRLNTQINFNVLADNLVNYPVALTDYTSMVVWTAAAGTINLPQVSLTGPYLDAGPVPANYYVSINNAGTGIITVQPPAGIGIQGQANLPVSPGQTLIVATPGFPVPLEDLMTSTWFTLGFGAPPTSTVTVNAINAGIPAPGYITLTASQAASLIQIAQGVLEVNTTVFFPVPAIGTGGNWIFYNATTSGVGGPYTLTVQLAPAPGGTGAAFNVPDGATLILYADNTSMNTAPTTAGGTVTSVGLASTTNNLQITGSPITTAGAITVNINPVPGSGSPGDVLAINTVSGINPPTLQWIPQTGGAPSTAAYVLNVPPATGLPNAVVLSTGSTALLKNVSGGGLADAVPSPDGLSGDYYAPGFPTTLQETSAPNLAVGNTISLGISGTNNVIVGITNYNSSATGSGNLIVGTGNLVDENGGSFNSIFGRNNLPVETNGNNNFVFGSANLATSTGASTNFIFGSANMHAATTANNNSAFGSSCLYNNDAGANNVAFGVNAGATPQPCNNCTFLGANADSTFNGIINSTAVGYGSVVTSSFSMVLGLAPNDVNVGINISNPTYGLHLGPAGTHFTPNIYFTGGSAPTPGTANDAVIYSNVGQMAVESGTDIYAGALVTADNRGRGGAQTVGTAQLTGTTTTISTISVTAASYILINYNSTAGAFTAANAGFIYVSATSAGANFTVTSSNSADTNFITWFVINALALA